MYIGEKTTAIVALQGNPCCSLIGLRAAGLQDVKYLDQEGKKDVSVHKPLYKRLSHSSILPFSPFSFVPPRSQPHIASGIRREQ
jgi:hypothetical protein